MKIKFSLNILLMYLPQKQISIFLWIHISISNVRWCQMLAWFSAWKLQILQVSYNEISVVIDSSFPPSKTWSSRWSSFSLCLDHWKVFKWSEWKNCQGLTLISFLTLIHMEGFREIMWSMQIASLHKPGFKRHIMHLKVSNNCSCLMNSIEKTVLNVWCSIHCFSRLLDITKEAIENV